MKADQDGLMRERCGSPPPRFRQSLFVLAAMCWPAVTANGQLQVMNGCMEPVYQSFNGGGTLNCTANDVRVASVTNITILDDGCQFVGDTVTFEADYEILLTAQDRHDIGIYLATDGNSALTGTMCTILTLPIPPTDLDMTGDDTKPTDAFGYCSSDGGSTLTIGPDLLPLPCNADGPPDCPVGDTCEEFGPGLQDTCGDIDASPNPIFLFDVVITATCNDPDMNGKLDLPNCTSWRQPGDNDLCLSPLAAFPGAPSKCRCEPGFDIAICVPGFCDDGNPCTEDVCTIDEFGDVQCSYNNEPLSTPCTGCTGGDTQCNDCHCDGAGACVDDPEPLSTPCEAESPADLCTTDHCDGSGNCVLDPGVPDNPVDCSPFNTECETFACDPDTGTCVGTPVGAGTACSTCPGGDTECNDCECDGAGACVDAAEPLSTSCTTCPGGVTQCNDCHCDGSGGCIDDPESLSTPCEAESPADLCTTDHCDGSGNCVLDPGVPDNPVDCSPFNTECETFACDPDTGTCVGTPVGAGTACSTCPGGDTECNDCECDGAGACADAAEPLSTSCTTCPGGVTQCNDCHCDGSGGCIDDPESLSTPCEAESPADLCTTDHCDGAGNCVLDPGVPDNPVDCSPFNTECETFACDPTTGTCVGTPVAAGTACTTCPGGDTQCNNCACDGLGACVDDPEPLSTVCEAETPADLCTTDHCDGAGNCVLDPGVPDNPVDCSPFDTECETFDCDPSTGTCVGTPEPSGTACTTCPGGDTQCNNCACDGLGACVDDPEPLSTVCEAETPADLCTTDHCDGAGNCVLDPGEPNNPVDCTPFNTTCETFTCNPSTGLCEGSAVAAGTACTTCPGGDTECNDCVCDGFGACVDDPEVLSTSCTTCSGGITQCNDCHCDGAGSCTNDPEPLSTVCEAETPADLCTTDHCDGAGNCVLDPGVPDNPVDCTPLNTECETFDCDPTTGTCVGTPEPSGTACSTCPGGDTQCNDCACDGLGACVDDPEPLSTVCEAETPADLCTKDHCDGAGNCVFDTGEPDNPVDCTPLNTECEKFDCDPATGTCVGTPEPSGTACTTCPGGDTDCSNCACDGAGACVDDPEPLSTACTTCPGGDTECNNCHCDGSGACADDPEPLSTTCTTCPGGDTECNNCHCDGAGTCADDPEPLSTPCTTCPIGDPKCCHCDGSGACGDNGECGACCDRDTQVCVSDLTEPQCETLVPDASQRRFGLGETCESDGGTFACPEHVGACCDRRIEDETERCVDDVPESECIIDDPDQVTWHKFTLCSEIECEFHKGACCDGIRGICTDNVFESDCNAASGLCKQLPDGSSQCTWYKFTACADVPGGCDPALGACCNPNTPPLEKARVCTDSVTQAQCLDDCPEGCPGGTPTPCTWFKGETCQTIVDDGLCEAEFCAIPTVSEWGLVILTLLLLIGAKIYFGIQRGRVPAMKRA